MENFWILILVSFFATNSLDKAESVQLEELPLQTFDELFVDEWWDKDEAEDLKTPPTNSGQIEPNSTDQNPPLRDQKVLKEKEERKHLVEKFDQMKAELMRDGFKNSYKQEIDKTVAKELGFCFQTIYNWKKELGQTKPNKYPHSEQKKLMKRYYAIKDQNPKIRDEDIAKMLKIGRHTLCNWKKQFNPNSVDGHSVEENSGSNVQEIDKSPEVMERKPMEPSLLSPVTSRLVLAETDAKSVLCWTH
uniref:Transposase n=1 Tax=Globodera rostochiensis TaxID=31243 RepID=A0A914HP78_GLORO